MATAFHTMPVSLTDEQYLHLLDLAEAFHMSGDELLQVAAVSKIEEMAATVHRLRDQLPLPDEEDPDTLTQHLRALAANHEARMAIDPEYKEVVEAEGEIEALKDATDEQKTRRWF
ncbi:MAG: hypothetical protein OXQ84_01790 [bacterium]|nr:hypothetical protein [bacterium]